jgi:hypothetical protein
VLGTVLGLPTADDLAGDYTEEDVEPTGYTDLF